MDTAAYVHVASKEATLHLTQSLIDDSVDFDIRTHLAVARAAGQAARSGRLGREQRHLDARAKDVPADGRRDKRNSASGVWLTVVPSRLNGSGISAEEWRDNVRLRYNLQPIDMPDRCDGCNCQLTVEHALSCKKGGLVHIRHDDVADEWRYLCGTALSFGRVECEPRIYSSVGRLVREAGEAAETPAAGERDEMQTTGERGDAGVHGFWQRQRMAIFDVRITDTDARSARGRDYTKILAAHEKEKKDKYLDPCHQMRKDFTPLVYTVDGIAGREARNAERRLAAHLGMKWKKGYSEMVHYVRVRMALAVVRANSLLLRGSRDRQRTPRPCIADGSALLDWQTWHDRP